MKNLILVSLIIMSFDSYGINCKVRYLTESFYLGAGKAFGYRVKKPSINDEVCWSLGVRLGKRLIDRAISDHDEDDCYDAFDSGEEQGLEARQSDLEYPQYCYDLGLKYGFSLLATGARDKYFDVVGNDCIEEYEKGFEAGISNRPITVRTNTKLAFCYRTGYADSRY
ncbi:MAG: hypothetical protein HOJ35_09325 [Bdellovibrionales bacterium]|jgi:hypothetical protein|nr:hypothetical protein [Bdellovibrionales bacterium]